MNDWINHVVNIKKDTNIMNVVCVHKKKSSLSRILAAVPQQQQQQNIMKYRIRHKM